MKTLWILSLFTFVGTCARPKYTEKVQNLKDSIELIDSALVVKFAKTISSKDLKKHLYVYASDEFEGRKTGEIGQKKAAEFLENYYMNEKIESAFEGNNYYQNIPESFFSNGIKPSENVLAYIEGNKKPDELIILSAHLDHLGISDDGHINYGADDDGSGTVALMEIAQAFTIAKDQGYGPNRSILFLHLTAEEIGKKGSEYYVQNPIFKLENTIANLNIDMIGRVDNDHENNADYLYLIGSDRLSKELHYISERVNSSFFNIDLDYKYNIEGEKNNYYTRSDHYNFAKNGIPVIFYFNGEHSDYHLPSDTPDKINYKLLEKRTQLIFATTWQLANQKNRLVIDENNELLK